MDKPVVGWLERPKEKVGLDNLGTQQPSIFIYTQLLPGVTNVTDRAAYFGFYPWFLLAFERRFPEASEAEFKNELRRADCLFTLIAERHAIVSQDNDDSIHGAACAGRQKLRPATEALSKGGTLIIDEYANRDDENAKRYFKNPLGGLGQYYLGPLRDEYFILIGNAKTGLNYFTENAEPLAASYGEGVDEDRFFRVLSQKTISASDLDDLAEFCPCAIHGGHREGARRSLLRLLLEDASGGGITRRMTFWLLMEFLQTAAGAPSQDPVRDFLGSCYGGVIGTEPWTVSAELTSMRSKWALYARNEMMSLAWSTFFTLALKELDGPPKKFQDIRDVALWLLGRESFAFPRKPGFAAMLEADRHSAPDISSLSSSEHEFFFWRRITSEPAPPVEAACRMLIRLVMRWGDEIACYAPIGLPKGALSPYPLTLDTMNRNAKTFWHSLSCEQWMQRVLVDTLCAHQRVAIRKLGEMGEDTLMFRITEAGLSIHRRQDGVVETQPRLRQALHMLLDLGLTKSQPGKLPTLTQLGLETLARLRQ